MPYKVTRTKGGLALFTELPRRRVFPETGLLALGLLGNSERLKERKEGQGFHTLVLL